MTKRRKLITVLGGAAVWPLAPRAQQGERVRRIGYLGSLDEKTGGRPAKNAGPRGEDFALCVLLLADLGCPFGRASKALRAPTSIPNDQVSVLATEHAGTNPSAA
jgi:hypothetical protein